MAVLVGLLVSVQSALAQTTPDFEDVPDGHIAKPAIEWAAENGITQGVGNNRFGMGQTLTRYQMVTFLCRAFNPGNCQTGTKGSARFDDVPEDHWANYSIGWAANQQITSGVSTTEFGGSQTLTREQMITFLHRAKGKPTGGSLGSDRYEDVPDDPTHWANLPIGWAYDQGISGGMPKGLSVSAPTCQEKKWCCSYAEPWLRAHARRRNSLSPQVSSPPRRLLNRFRKKATGWCWRSGRLPKATAALPTIGTCTVLGPWSGRVVTPAARCWRKNNLRTEAGIRGTTA